MPDFALSPEQRRAFLLMLAGHLLYAIAFYLAGMWLQIEYFNVWITPLFALPLLIWGPRDRLAVRALVLLVGFTAVHYVAMWAAISSVPIPTGRSGLSDSPWVPGAIGGAIGGIGSLGLCLLAGLLRPGTRSLCLLGVLLLTLVGSLGVANTAFATGGAARIFGWYVLYTPWQLAFAYVLAKVLKL
jgi:hypothetical protein